MTYAPDRPLLGILLMLGFCFLAPMSDAIAKLLGGTVPVLQMLAIRFALQAAALLVLVRFIGKDLRMSARVLRLTVLRTLLHVAGGFAMILSLRFLPLADAVAIAFVMPFLMLLLGKYVLHEVIGGLRLGACVVGFIGTMLVIQPSFASVGWAATLPLLVAVSFALFMLVTRQIARDTDPIVLQTVSGAIATLILMPLLWLFDGSGWAELDPVWPSARSWALLAALGLLGTVAHLLMTWSLRFAPSATLAPMQYLEIPFATLIGWIVFGHLPNGLAALGITITIVAGLFIVWREHRAGKAA